MWVCEHISPHGVLWSKGPNLYVSDGVEGRPQFLGCVDVPDTLALNSRCFGWYRRMLRRQFYVARYVTSSLVFVCFAKGFGWVQGGRYTSIRIPGERSRVLRDGVAVLPDGRVVFGEYRLNPNRSAVNLYVVFPGARYAQILYRFAPGQVRHVHSVTYDAYDNSILVCTGDTDSESKLLRFSICGSSYTELGSGSQVWRIVSPRLTADCLYWGTDSDTETNQLIRFDRRAASVARISPLPGPVYYSLPVIDGALFATTIEGCNSEQGKFAEIFHLRYQSGQLRKLASYKKDRLSPRWFQPGVIKFPIVDAECKPVPYSGTALCGLNDRLAWMDVHVKPDGAY